MGDASEGGGDDGRLKLNRLARNLSNSDKLWLLLEEAVASSWKNNDLWDAAALADDIGDMAE